MWAERGRTQPPPPQQAKGSWFPEGDRAKFSEAPPWETETTKLDGKVEDEGLLGLTGQRARRLASRRASTSKASAELSG